MVRCKKCKKEIKDKSWPVENTKGLCPDCAYEDFLASTGGEKGKEQARFEKQLRMFLDEFNAAVKVADGEDRFLTPEELRIWEEKLRRIWETHICSRGMQEYLGLFKQCFSCPHRNTPTDPLMTLGVIRCQNPGCEHRERFSEMFNTIYTKDDVDRAKERMDELTRTPEDFIPDNLSNISGEDMEHNTDRKQKEHIEQREKEKDAKGVMYA